MKKAITIRELIELLKQEPNQDAIVVHRDEGFYYGCTQVVHHGKITEWEAKMGLGIEKGQYAVVIM